jgi:3-deoxy-D-manno-octulosonic-acid transferase
MGRHDAVCMMIRNLSSMIKIVYNLLIRCYGWLIGFVAGRNEKARHWKNGREDLFNRLAETDFSKDDWLWIHCASLGEFEQGRPVIEMIKEQSNYQILLTFFSPSGFLKRKNFPLADVVSYIPLDTPQNAHRFISITQPKSAIFVRYEFWYNHLTSLKENGIPTYLISASFRKKQLFFQPLIGSWFRKMLNIYEMIYTIDQESIQLLKNYEINHCEKIGDTRADRVVEIKSADEKFELIEQFKGDSLLIICGSTWKEDISVLLKSLLDKEMTVKWIIAPHEVGKDKIDDLVQLLNNNNLSVAKYSNPIHLKDADILLIDNIGILAKIYKYGDCVYIGGGFGTGIHNVLEPAIFGNPVIMGPKHTKFPEAIGLMNFGGAFSIHSSAECHSLIKSLLNDAQKKSIASRNAQTYVKDISGATPYIVQQVLQKLNSIKT